jgi:hypothetical protein
MVLPNLYVKVLKKNVRALWIYDVTVETCGSGLIGLFATAPKRLF